MSKWTKIGALLLAGCFVTGLMSGCGKEEKANKIVLMNFKPEAKTEAINQIKSQLENFYNNGISDRELNKAKKKLKASFAESSETVSEIAENIGFYITV